MRHATHRMPLVLRALVGLIGVSSLIGSLRLLAGRPEDWRFALAGSAVGVIWLIVAALGTLPLRASVGTGATHLSEEARWAAGLTVIRRRSRWAQRAVVIWLPLGIAVLALGYEVAGLVVLVAGALLSGGLNVLYIQSACPRCGDGFFALPGTRGMLAWPTRQCRHCGLREPGA